MLFVFYNIFSSEQTPFCVGRLFAFYVYKEEKMSNTKKDFQRSVILGEGDSDINGEKKGFIAWVNACMK